MLFDPIPDPIAAGWTKEGEEPHVPSGTSLRINDTTNAGLARFYAEDPSAFSGEIELNPIVLLNPAFSAVAEESTGVHVAINDGDREIRVDVFGVPGGGLRVALRLATQYSEGFAFPTTHAAFQVKRLADGSALLAVAGQAPEAVPRLALAGSSRPGLQTIEFGCDNRGGVVSSDWYTLGLPPPPRQTPFASFTVDRLQLRVRT